ncbi:hypothetical protein BZA05DRAFT_275540 [Tricharina praecox]|uniref:uncharacterized protein n=1 Tax=Tricharina praecox TaxID=43433 RepID=UPI00221EBEB8|nr:uncharacterized protein BZA05DRAFT_275540 [Tricharina praecox]KAI5853966.1 hypothetical protein BZA05DRAFT_275540 [Tricharina praecox]
MSLIRAVSSSHPLFPLLWGFLCGIGSNCEETGGSGAGSSCGRGYSLWGKDGGFGGFFFPSSINEFRDFWRGSREKKKSCFEQTLQCSIAGRWEVKEEDDVLSSLSIVIASAI